MSTNKYLDSSGLSHLWDRITSKIDDVAQTAASDVAAIKAGYIGITTVNNVEYIGLWANEDAYKANEDPISTLDVSDFLADSVLEDVTVVVASQENPIYVEDEETSYTKGSFIKFMWKLADGTTKTEYLNAENMGKVYSAGTGISLENDQISVSSVTADITKTTRELSVSSAIGDYAAGTKIAENTDIMTILSNLLEKTLGVKVTNPSVSLSKTSGSDAGTYEYGTKIDAVFTASLNTGKYEGDGWTKTDTSTGIEPTSYTWTNATGSSETGTVAINSLKSTTTVKCTINHTQGKVPTNNKGNNTSGQITATSTSATKTYTPVKYWWVGYSNNKFADTTWESDTVRALSLASNVPVTTKTKTPTFPQGSKQKVIAVPDGTSFTIKNSKGEDITGTYYNIQNVNVTCGQESVAYKVYVAAVNAGLEAASTETITLK